MKIAHRFSAFTLAELLIVLVIMGVMMLLATGFTKTTRDTFVSQQYIKTVLTTSRILRRKSMLITRNSGESNWVNGIGFKITKDVDSSWVLTQQKLLANNSYYYRTYPAENTISSGLFATIDNTQTQRLQKDIQLKFAITNGTQNEKDCMANLKTLYVIFESINGRMHAYCVGNAQFIPLGLTAPTTYNPNLNISILYQSGKYYGYKLVLNSNGEISVKK